MVLLVNYNLVIQNLQYYNLNKIGGLFDVFILSVIKGYNNRKINIMR
jgi:hypothetical protein